MNSITPVALAALLHLYVGWRLTPALVAWPLAIAAIIAILLISFALLTLGWRLHRRVHRYADYLSWASMTAMGLFSSLFVLTLLRDVLLLLLSLISLALPITVLSQIAMYSAPLVPLAALVMTAVGMWNARRTAAVVNIDVPIYDLPDALSGFTIAQITDIHVGPTIKGPYLENIVAAVNPLGADMVAITGDLVDGSVAELAQHVSSLAKLTSRHGTFFVTGNHEYL